MVIQQNKIILANTHPRFLYDMFIQHFAWEQSPDYPVYVYYQVALQRTGLRDIIEGEFHTFRIGEATGDMNYPTRELAQIVLQSFPPNTVLVIQSESAEVSPEDWAKVERLTRKIIASIRQAGYEIVVVEPAELASEASEALASGADIHLPPLPKTAQTLARWRQAYAIILARRAAYEEEFKDSLRRKRGRNSDYQDAIAHELGWLITDRTLSKIIRAGEAGLLE
jgi:hypothetical protein